MNIIRLTTRIYPDIGGPAVYTYKLSKYLSKKNFRMFNLSCKPDHSFNSKKKVTSNFKINYFPIIVPSENDKLHKKIFFVVKFLLYSVKTILKLHRKYRIDLIHCDNPPITGVIATLFNIIYKIPFIYTQHGPKIDSPYFLDYLLEARLVYRYSTYYIIISRKYKLYY
ncbi:MAG: glycosyltransferase, partial [Promethearchaeota archaeon]